MISNREIVLQSVTKHPGLRFHELKKETNLANGTLQHHLSKLLTCDDIITVNTDKNPRYFQKGLEDDSAIMINRLRQNTTSKIIKSLLKNGCLSFRQIVKESKKSAGTISIYKNMLLQDHIIVGDTDECESCPEMANKIKYRLTNPSLVRSLVDEYGKSSLKKSADNLADIFLSLK